MTKDELDLLLQLSMSNVLYRGRNTGAVNTDGGTMQGPKVIDKLPFEQYCELPGEHSSGLRDMLESPLLYRWRRDKGRKDSDQLRVGRGGHTAILEPDRFLLEYAAWRNGKNNKARPRRGKTWDAFKEANGDKTVLTEAQYMTALAVRDSARKHPAALRLLEEQGRNELTVTWTDERTGLLCRARFDRLCSALVDIKLTHDPSPRRFSVIAANFDYATQLAFYREAARVAGLGKPPVMIIAAQSKEPYDCVVFEMDEEMLGLGDARYKLALDRVVECNKSGKWPGAAPDEAVPLELPPWLSVQPDKPTIMLDDEVIQ